MQRAAVLTRELPEQLEPLVHLLEPAWVPAFARRVLAQRARSLVQLGRRPAHRLRERGQGGIDLGQLLDAPRGLPCRDRGRALAGAEQLLGFLGPAAQLLGPRAPLT